MRQAIAMLLLGVVGLFFVYGAVVAAEAVSTTALVSYLGNDVGVPGVVIRIVILSVTTFPIAYLTGYGLLRWVPALGLRIICVVALLYTLIIGLLQLYVYSPSTLVASMLKILFVVVPLAMAGYRNRPERVT